MLKKKLKTRVIAYRRQRREGRERVWWWLEVESTEIFSVPKRDLLSDIVVTVSGCEG